MRRGKQAHGGLPPAPRGSRLSVTRESLGVYAPVRGNAQGEGSV
jgi:hypothetical protein